MEEGLLIPTEEVVAVMDLVMGPDMELLELGWVQEGVTVIDPQVMEQGLGPVLEVELGDMVMDQVLVRRL